MRDPVSSKREVLKTHQRLQNLQSLVFTCCWGEFIGHVLCERYQAKLCLERKTWILVNAYSQVAYHFSHIQLFQTSDCSWIFFFFHCFKIELAINGSRSNSVHCLFWYVALELIFFFFFFAFLKVEEESKEEYYVVTGKHQMIFKFTEINIYWIISTPTRLNRIYHVGREQISQDGMFRLPRPTFCK